MDGWDDDMPPVEALLDFEKKIELEKSHGAYPASTSDVAPLAESAPAGKMKQTQQRYVPICLQGRRFPGLSQIFINKQTASLPINNDQPGKENQPAFLPIEKAAAIQSHQNGAKRDALIPSNTFGHQERAPQSSGQGKLTSHARLGTAEANFQTQELAQLTGEGQPAVERQSTAVSAKEATRHLSRNGGERGYSHPGACHSRRSAAGENRLASHSAAEFSGRQQGSLRCLDDGPMQRSSEPSHQPDSHLQATKPGPKDTSSEWLQEDAFDDWPDDSFMVEPEPKRMKMAPQGSLQGDIAPERAAPAPLPSTSHVQQKSSGPASFSSFSYQQTAGGQHHGNYSEAAPYVHNAPSKPNEGRSMPGQVHSRESPHRTSQAPKPVTAGRRMVQSGAVRLGPNGQIDFELPRHQDIQAALARLPGVEWINTRRVWRTTMETHTSVIQALHNLPNLDMRIEGLHDVPQKVLQVTATRQDDNERYASIPESLQKSLMEFQRTGVRFGLSRGGRILIGDEMGLGKTVQAVALLAAYRDKWPALVITPASLREQWADALHDWLHITEKRFLIVNTGKDADLAKHIFCGHRATRDFLIISYTFLSRLKDVIADQKFKLVVLDECHAIKDSKAQRTKDAIPVLQKADHAVLLSGTPMISRPKEMLTLLSSLVPEAKLKMKDFGERYCLSSNPKAYSKYDGCCNHEELNRLLTSTVMIRRLKKEVLDQLPPKRRQQVFLKLDRNELEKLTKQSSAMEAARSMVDRSLGDHSGGGQLRQEQQAAVMQLYRLTAEVKVKVVQHYVEGLLDEDQKFLIFCHHKVMNDGIAEVLNKKRTKHIVIDGSVPPQKRQGLVNDFQNDTRVKVALLSIQAAGVGLTLTSASVVVFAELAWSPGEIFQAEDRAHRIGQPSSVNVYFLHVKQSVDDLMWTLIQNKLDNVGQAINGCKEGFNLSTSMTQREQNQGSLKGYMQPSSTGANPSIPASFSHGKSVTEKSSGGPARETGEQRQTNLMSLWKK